MTPAKTVTRTDLVAKLKQIAACPEWSGEDELLRVKARAAADAYLDAILELRREKKTGG